MTNPRLITSTLETYQKARQQFAQSISDLAQRAQNCQLLLPALPLLGPLLTSGTPSEVNLSALAVGRIAAAGYAEEVHQAGLVGNLVQALTGSSGNGGKGRSVSCALKNIAKHSRALAQCVVEAGALPKLSQCLSEFDPTSRESAALCFATIAQHGEDLAWQVVKLGVLQSLTSALQEPELGLRVSTAACLAEIAKHTPELAQAVVDVGAVFVLAKLLESPSYDSKLRKTVLTALSAITKHGAELAETVVEADIYPGALLLLKDVDESVRRAAMELTKEICKQSADLAQLMVSIGTVGAAVDYLNTLPAVNSAALPAILALGFVAAHSESLASSVIAGRAVAQLGSVLEGTGDAKVLSAAVWALGQIGQHSAEHSRALTLGDAGGVLKGMLSCAMSRNASLASKSSSALKLVLQRCTELLALEPLFMSASKDEEIRSCLLAQFAKVLPSDPSYRKSFVTSGCLKVLQEFDLKAGSDDKEYRLKINQCFPPEIVKYYSPGYPDDLLNRIENFAVAETTKN